MSINLDNGDAYHHFFAASICSCVTPFGNSADLLKIKSGISSSSSGVLTPAGDKISSSDFCTTSSTAVVVVKSKRDTVGELIASSIFSVVSFAIASANLSPALYACS